MTLLARALIHLDSQCELREYANFANEKNENSRNSPIRVICVKNLEVGR